MAIDDQPMNVYWSGKRTETVNRSKINYKGSVTAFSDLPDTNNQKGDMYSVTNLSGENYIWNGEEWDSLGTSDTNVVHKTGDETVAGKKAFTSEMTVQNISAFKQIPDIADVAQAPSSNTTINVLTVSDNKKENIVSLSHLLRSNGTGDFSIKARGTGNNSGITVRSTTSGKFVIPISDTDVSLGASSMKWKELYASSGTIQTSDANFKEQIESIPNSVLDAWDDVDFVQFKMKAAVQSKGIAARLHTGIIAQSVVAAFQSAGVDADRYGLYCADDDEKGGELLSIRYAEALCMEAAYQRRRADRLEARIVALEALVEGDRQ